MMLGLSAARHDSTSLALSAHAARTGLVLATFVFCCAPIAVFARPAYCDQVAEAALKELQAPYSQQTTSDGSTYCEGLLVNPIAMLPASVVSVKQRQIGTPPFTRDGHATLTWCDDSKQPVHVRLRSVAVPWFGLDAQRAGSFRWSTTLVAVWQPNWDNLTAIAEVDATVDRRKLRVVTPVRLGSGHSSEYLFLLRSASAINFSKVLVQRVDSKGQPRLLDVVLNKGPVSNTWQVPVSFGAFSAGIYRMTFQESADAPGMTSTPIYVSHRICPAAGG